MGRPVSITIAETIPNYRQYLEGLRKSRNTVEHYVGYVRRFGELLDGDHPRTGFPVYEISCDEVARLFKTLTPSTFTPCKTALKSWLKYCVKKKYISRPAAEDALDEFVGRTPHYERQEKLFIPADRFTDLLDAAEAMHPRDRIIVAIALYTMARESEITPMTLADAALAVRDREIPIYRQKTKRRTVSGVDLDLHAELTRWLAWYAQDQGYVDADALLDAHPEWYLMPRLKQRGRTNEMMPDHLVSAGLEEMAKKVFVACGFTGRTGRATLLLGEGMHTFRRSAARALYLHLSEELGEERALLTVMVVLNHKKPQITLAYIGIEVEAKRVNERLKTVHMFGQSGPYTPAGGGAEVIPFTSLANGNSERRSVVGS